MTKIFKLKNFTLLQLYARAAAPCRDYYGLTIAESCISLNAWKITHGPHVTPKQKFCLIEEVQDDKFLQEEIKNMFGVSVYEYIIDLGNKKRKLENLPAKLFLRVLEYMSINDVLHLSLTSKIFYELCNSERVWCLMFQKTLQRCPSPDEHRMAFDYGWREVLKRRMTYIRKAFADSKAKKNMQPLASKKKIDKGKIIFLSV
ncbi:hypothetical protein NQ314_000723 [Rhamnusium bicolor]|uniref:F-box domain-containing protein n=1 Tax=Rhamnusium bicolor TaxID=1586634 RepID=A0AAV8ZVX2_9CUCU|nr:hypothetical protein NQ314_000723 [Rhamnusium bicolor]